MIDTRFAPYGALVLRVALGVMFIAHAYLKFAVFTVPGFTGFLGQVGLPGFLAWPIILAELLGGLAILTGFYGRYVSVLLLPMLYVMARKLWRLVEEEDADLPYSDHAWWRPLALLVFAMALISTT